MNITAIVEALVDAGASPEMILAAVRSAETQKDAAADASKAKARDRVARWRAAHPSDQSNVTERSVTSQNAPQRLTGGDARVDDKTSTSENIQKEESKTERRRATRLPSDWTLPLEWRADAPKAGLPELRIDTEALNMRDWSLSSPNGAKLDWRAAWRTWCRRAAKDRPRDGPGPPKPKTAADFLMAETMDRVNGHSGQETGDWADAGGVSSITVAGSARRLGLPDGR